jgi:hypothetical protein
MQGVSNFDISKCKLSVKHKILLTMMRLKLDIPFAVFFNVSASPAHTTFQSTRGLLKRSFHSRFKMAHSCQKRPNIRTNSLNKLLL